MNSLLTIVLAFALLLIVGWSSPSGAATIRDNTIACTWPVLEQLRELRTDNEAFKKRLIIGVLSGECITLNAGERVMVLERSVWSNASRVKKPGSIRTDLWVPGQYDVA